MKRKCKSRLYYTTKKNKLKHNKSKVIYHISVLLTFSNRCVGKKKDRKNCHEKDRMLIGKSFLVPKNLLDRLGLVHIQSVLLNISDNRIRQQILYRHPTSDE